MLSDLSLLERVRDVGYLDPQTWFSFVIVAAIALVGGLTLTRAAEVPVIALKNRLSRHWTAPGDSRPAARRELTMLLAPAAAGALSAPTLAWDAGDAGFLIAHGSLLDTASWTWPLVPLLIAVALFALTSLSLTVQVLRLFGTIGLFMLPAYLACAGAAFTAGALGAPVMLVLAIATAGEPVRALWDGPAILLDQLPRSLRPAAADNEAA